MELTEVLLTYVCLLTRIAWLLYSCASHRNSDLIKCVLCAGSFVCCLISSSGASWIDVSSEVCRADAHPPRISLGRLVDHKGKLGSHSLLHGGEITSMGNHIGSCVLSHVLCSQARQSKGCGGRDLRERMVGGIGAAWERSCDPGRGGQAREARPDLIFPWDCPTPERCSGKLVLLQCRCQLTPPWATRHLMSGWQD